MQRRGHLVMEGKVGVLLDECDIQPHIQIGNIERSNHET
jgi:hypothetical protein